MGLDIEFKTKKKVVCPHCGEIVKYEDGFSVCSGGRSWYQLLEEIGYYVPYDERTDDNDWYGKDMTLSDEQLNSVYQFVKIHQELYDASQVLGLLAAAKYDGDTVVVNADW